MTYTQGRYILSDTDAYGARDMPGLVSQVKLMRDTFLAGIKVQAGLIIIAVDDSQRKAAKRRILSVLNTAETDEEVLRKLLFEVMVKLHQLPGVMHCGTKLEDMVIEALDLPPHSGVDYARYWQEREQNLDG